VNPLQLEPILWASGLQDLLWTFFLLAALRVYLGAQVLLPWRLCVSALLVLLALFSKETAVCFVLLIPAVDVALYRFARGRLTAAAYVCFALVLAVYLGLRQSHVTVASEPFVAPTRYFVKQFLATPYRLFSHPWSDQVALPPGWLAFAIAAVLMVLLTRASLSGRARSLLVGPAIILASTLPLHAYFTVFSTLYNARYLYFPAVGWSILLANMSFGRHPSRLLHVTTGLTIIVFLAIFLARNTAPWRSASSLVQAMGMSVAEGADGRSAAAAWQARTGIALEMKDGIPVSCQGIDILRNSYAEFLDYYRKR
jgi:hypothetical protein